MNVTLQLDKNTLTTVGLFAWYFGWMPLLTWLLLIWLARLQVSWLGVEVTYMFLYSLILTYTFLRWQAARTQALPESEDEPVLATTETTAQVIHRLEESRVLGKR